MYPYKLNLFPCNKKACIPYSRPTQKEDVDGHVATGVTSIPRHLATIMSPFFLDVG